MNPFPYSNTNKRYYTYDYFLKTTFHEKVFKVALDAGFSCPNRDGSCGSGGCTFCSSAGSGDFAGDVHDSLNVQFDKIRLMMHQKWPVAKYIAYFQAYTNTYAPVDVLKSLFEPFLGRQDVVGIAIATRPDCIPEDVLDYLDTIHQRTHLWVELGLQTRHDTTANEFNRGYLTSVFTDTVQRLRARGIRVLAHLINGLKGETPEMMIESARFVAMHDVQGIKIHSLCILKNTVLGDLYEHEPWELLSEDQYVDIVVRQLEILPPNLVVQRVTGDANKSDLIAPTWSLRKTAVTNHIDQLMVKKDTFQGKFYGSL